MGFWSRWFGGNDRAIMVPLYTAIVAEARRPDWYLSAAVPDTLDGRFDVLALLVSLTLIRFELEGESGRIPSVRLTEVMIDDLDGTMREIGFGDLVVGKQVGGAMGALGGRLGAYREADRRPAMIRNLYRNAQPTDAAVDAAVKLAAQFEARVAATPFNALVAGSLT
jgi:cytochrome b pre-mRNA-processing protein 3